MAGFHEAVAQGTQRVGLAGAGEPEGQHVDAVFHEAALGQLVSASGALAKGQGHPVMLESLPSLARGELGYLTQPVDAPMAAILSFLLQHLEEGGQSVAVAGFGDTGHRLGAHGGSASGGNWRQSSPMRSYITLVSVSIIRTPPTQPGRW